MTDEIGDVTSSNATEQQKQVCRAHKDGPFCEACGTAFGTDFMWLKDVEQDKPDKLGNRIDRILWADVDFKIYSTNAGVFVHFSDCGQVAREQRRLFNQVHPRLCELRFLTSRMGIAPQLNRSKIFDTRIGWFHQEMARSIVQALADRCKHARDMLDFVTEMASERVMNENRVRYLAACGAVAMLGVGALLLLSRLGFPDIKIYSTASGFGALGAVFSILISIGSLALVPSRHSMMNYIMGGLRVLTGMIAGGLLVLVIRSGLVGPLGAEQFGIASSSSKAFELAALLGFVAGFAERLVPNMMTGAAEQLAAYRLAEKQGWSENATTSPESERAGSRQPGE
jgi:hypothetical protein